MKRVAITTCTLHTGVDEIALNNFKINSFIHVVVLKPRDGGALRRQVYELRRQVEARIRDPGVDGFLTV